MRKEFSISNAFFRKNMGCTSTASGRSLTDIFIWSWRARLSNTELRRLRIVERLAQKMYEASEAGNILWLRRGWIVRETWMKKAQERLEGAGNSVNRPYAWWSVWEKIKILHL